MRNILLQKITSPFKIVVFFLLLSLVSFSRLYGQTNIWDGSTDNNWNTDENWSLNVAPTQEHDVLIDINAAISANVNSTINSLTINNSAVVSITSSGGDRTITIDDNGSSIGLGSSLTLRGSSGGGTRSMSIVYSGTNRTMLVGGSLILTAVGEGTIYAATNSLTTVTGAIMNDGSGGGTAGVINSTAANLSFSSGSTYQHARNGGTIPTATWHPNSNCIVSGITTTGPSGLNQTFGNFTWNCTGQGTNNVVSTGGNMVVAGNFTLNAGIFAVSNSTTQQRTLTIAGNYIQTGGTFDFNRVNNGLLSTVYLAGNISNSSSNESIITDGIDAINGQIIFNGSSTQTINFTNPGAAQWVTFTVNNGSLLELSSNITLTGYNSDPIFYADFIINGSIDFKNFVINDASLENVPDASHFTLNSGATLITANLDGISLSGNTGSVQINGPRSYNAGGNYIYNGSSTQITGNGLTGANNLTINNNSGVTLTSATAVSGSLALTNGMLTTGTSNLLTVNNTATNTITGGSTTNFINGPVKWTMATGSYIFPVGNGSGNYLPFTLATSAASSPVVTIEAFNGDVGAGATFDATLTSLSHTEYWRAQLNSGTFTGKVSLSRPTALTTEDVIAKSTLQAGDYSSIGGTASSPSIGSSDDISSFSYFVMAAAAKKCPVSTSVTPSTDQMVCQDVATNQLTASITTSSGTGNPTFQYQWYYNTTNSNVVMGATKISGATDPTYTPLSGVTEVGTRYYFCVGYASNNGCGQTDDTQSQASNVVAVAVNALPATPTITASGPTTFCSGGSVTLTSSAGDSYLWSTAETTQSITVSTAGNYTVQVTNAAGCQSAASAATVVTVNSPSSAPTSITGTTTICNGGSTTLTTSGGSLGSDARDVWYEGACASEAFTQEWTTQPYTTYQTTVNSVMGGILTVTSKNNSPSDPMIHMENIGNFNTATYKYIQIRYRVVSGTAGRVQIYYSKNGGKDLSQSQFVDASLISDNNWHIINLDMSVSALWTGKITGWRFDYCTSALTKMDIDFITLSDKPILGEGSSISVSPAVSTTYFTRKKGACNSTSCVSQLVTVNATNTVSAASSSPTPCINTAMTSITHSTTRATGIGTATGLPAGVAAAWAANTITISGAPSVAGVFNYTIPLAGGCGTVLNATGTITVSADNTVGAASSSPTPCINTAMTSITHSTTGATGIGTATGLPAGVAAAWAANTITISGTPTASGVFAYTIPLTGGCGSVNATGTITVTANMTVTASTPQTLCINTALSPNLTHTTTLATGIIQDGLTGVNGLPAGVSATFASNTITISGTPSEAGTFNYSIPLTGSCGTVNATGTITVSPLIHTNQITQP